MEIDWKITEFIWKLVNCRDFSFHGCGQVRERCAIHGQFETPDNETILVDRRECILTLCHFLALNVVCMVRYCEDVAIEELLE